MATTAATSSTSTAATDAQTAAATKRASAQKIITSLSAGSGVDVAALAQGLVEAERAPQENVINAKISKNEARVSGYSAVKFMLSNVKDALTGLKDANSFNATSANNSNTSALSVTAGTGADIGNHSVAITTLASAQRNISTSFASNSTALNDGDSFTMDLTVGSASTSTAAVSGLTINGTAIAAVSADPTIVTSEGYAAAVPSHDAIVVGDGTTTYSTVGVTFSALAAGQAVTVNGLTFTATAAMTATQVGDAFASIAAGATTGPSTSLGTYSNTMSANWASGTNSAGVVTFTATDLDTLTDTMAASTAPGRTETAVITFAALGAGHKATLNGLTFTATAAMTAAEVASAFGGLTSGDTDGNTTGAALGTYSGTFTAGFTTADWSSGTSVTATTTSATSSVTDIAITVRKFDNLATAINAQTTTTGVSAVNSSGALTLTGTTFKVGTTTASTEAITGISAYRVTVASGYDTPSGLVNAINTAGLDVTARLVNAGTSISPSYKVVLTGATGADSAFSMSTSPSTVLTTLDFTTASAAGDAVLTVDGVTYTRSANTLTDVLDGVTMNLLSASTTATISLARDTTEVVSKIDALVAAYNEANSLFTEVTNSKSELDIYGATLVGDTTVRMVRTQLREALLGESSTPGTNVTAAWQMGLSVDKAGVMTLDKTKLTAALTDNFADVVTTFTANQNNRTATSPPYSSSAGYSSATSSLNGSAAFTVTITSADGTEQDFAIAAANSTPQGVVDAINATDLGYTASLVQETSGTLPYKIVVVGSIGGSRFTLTAADADGDTVSDLNFSSSGSGIAGDTLRKITSWLATTSPLSTQSVNAESQNAKYADELAALQTRMDELLARYTKQFSAMESLVGSINSQKTSLKSTFDGMMSMYTNN
jgi:flagellar hook-associated protein 2